MIKLKQHTPFIIILIIHLALGLTYASLIPLGEAPDESAHLAYAQFIAQNGHLPTTLPQRRAAGYRATWPPLYHFLVAAPLAAVSNAPPTRLKSVGDTPRRLIPTNGQTIASFIHTADEAWPWRGIVLAWHLGRFISVGLMALSVVVTYAIACRLTPRRWPATAAAALHAFLPQALFVGAAVSDDNPLILLSGLVLLVMVRTTQRPAPPGVGRFLLVGTLLGLASVAKYNALPLWAVAILWTLWLARRHTRSVVAGLRDLVALLAGAALTGGWWFAFVWYHFNQIDTQGWLAGSLAALSAGTADASLRRLSGGGALGSLPPLSGWLAWVAQLFKSFWGLFGGGGTIGFAGWVYGLLAGLCLLAMWGLVRRAFHAIKTTGSPPPIGFFLLVPFFFLPLPVLRFILSGSVAETAQGRHLFPALPLIALALILGWSGLVSGFRFRVSGFRFQVSGFTLLFPIFSLGLSLYSLPLILGSYPPPIPLRTTPDAAPASSPLRANLAQGVTLIGVETGQPENGHLPVTLIWQAESIPPQDYLTNLTLTDAAGQPIGGWVGHPIGGRYPTRAWDEGDILRDTIPLPLLPNLPPTQASLSLRLLETTGQPATPPLTLIGELSIPQTAAGASIPPAQLRADGLPSDASFGYRSTLTFMLPIKKPPALVAPGGQTFTATTVISNAAGSVAHFLVAAHWPSGSYQLPATGRQVPVSNRPRQFEPPPMAHPLNANFGGQITLLGYDMPQRRVQPGRDFPVTLHLQAQRTMGQNLVIFNHLLDQNAVQRGGRDRIPQNYYTTLLWVPGEIVSDSYAVPVEATAPPGIYWLDVGLYPASDPTRSLPLVENGQSIERNSVMLGPIKVGGPPPDVVTNNPDPQVELARPFGPAGEITLLGYDIHNSEPGTLNSKLTLYWQVNAPLPANYTVFVHLVDAQGNVAAQADSPPAAGAYPTGLWDAGEIIVDPHPLPNLEPGRYRVLVGLYRPDTGERLPIADRPDGALPLMELEITP